MKSIFVIFIILYLHILALFSIWQNGLIFDEHYHYNQIQRFMKLNFTLDPELPMAPGYHTAISMVSRGVGIQRLPYYNAYPFVRFISFLLSLSGIFAFWLIARKIGPASSLFRTVQYSIFPLIFPFYSLLYTDVVSLSILLFSLVFFLRRRFLIANLFGVLSILFRQNNVLWIGFFTVLMYVLEYGYTIDKIPFMGYLKRSWPFLMCVFVFVGLLLYFGGASSGGQTYVSIGLFVPQNLFVMLFVSFLLFFPLFVTHIRTALKLIHRYPWLLTSLMLFPLFQGVFQIEHPYNRGSFFLHNLIMEFFTADLYRKLIFYVIMLLSLLFLATLRLKRHAYYLLYPMTVFFFATLWFIELRYTFIPFSLFLLFRKTGKPWIEYVLTGWFVILTLFVFQGIIRWKFFL